METALCGLMAEIVDLVILRMSPKNKRVKNFEKKSTVESISINIFRFSMLRNLENCSIFHFDHNFEEIKVPNLIKIGQKLLGDNVKFGEICRVKN